MLVFQLAYTGIVTLSQYIGTKKIKLAQMYNKGGDSLFTFISDCLTGDFDIARLNRPTKIMLLNCSKENDDSGNTININYESASGFIYLVSKPAN